jgi:hypothetical protein
MSEMRACTHAGALYAWHQICQIYACLPSSSDAAIINTVNLAAVSMTGCFHTSYGVQRRRCGQRRTR